MSIMKVTPYPLREQMDFRSAPSIEAAVEPGKSAGLTLPGEGLQLGVTLARGLVVFAWKGGKSTDITAALKKNRRTLLTVDGGMLYVLNTGDAVARFRVERRGGPGSGALTFDAARGFERVFAAAGTIQFRLPELPEGMELYVAGTKLSSRLWAANGKIYAGNALKQRKNFKMESYAPGKRDWKSGGTLVIEYGPGLVKLWAAPAGEELSFMGQPQTAAAAQLKNSMGRIGQTLQQWQFTLDKACYITAETTIPTAMALLADNKLLYTSIAADSNNHQLNHYLKPGTYHLLTRPIKNKTTGTLTLKTITPTPLDESKEPKTYLIRPNEIQVFHFTVLTESNTGIGLKTESDHLDAVIYNEQSQKISQGPLTIKKLPPGTYLMVVTTKKEPVQYQPVILGHKGSRSGVPAEVVKQYKK